MFPTAEQSNRTVPTGRFAAAALAGTVRCTVEDRDEPSAGPEQGPKPPFKVFVSGKVGAEETVQKVIEQLRGLGYEITLDWTAIDHLKPYNENAETSSFAAMLEVRAVQDADALVVIPHEQGVGMYVELGVALGTSKPVYVITTEPSRTMFFHHPLVRIVASSDELSSVLSPSDEQAN